MYATVRFPLVVVGFLELLDRVTAAVDIAVVAVVADIAVVVGNLIS